MYINLSRGPALRMRFDGLDPPALLFALSPVLGRPGNAAHPPARGSTMPMPGSSGAARGWSHYPLIAALCLLWPVIFLVMLWMFTLRIGPAVARATGKSVSRQMLEQFWLAIRHSIPPDNYYVFDLFRPERLRNAAALHPALRAEGRRSTTWCTTTPASRMRPEHQRGAEEQAELLPPLLECRRRFTRGPAGHGPRRHSGAGSVRRRRNCRRTICSSSRPRARAAAAASAGSCIGRHLCRPRRTAAWTMRRCAQHIRALAHGAAAT